MAEKKRKITPEYVKKVREYNNENYEKMTLEIPKGIKGRWKTEAEKRGMSLTRLVKEAVEKYITETGNTIPEEPEEN